MYLPFFLYLPIYVARRCYNAVKNYQLGWYDLQIDSHDPIDFVGYPQSFVLNGVADYKKDGKSDAELISLRLEQFGDNDGVDFYLVSIIIIIVVVIIIIVVVVVSSWFNKIYVCCIESNQIESNPFFSHKYVSTFIYTLIYVFIIITIILGI